MKTYHTPFKETVNLPKHPLSVGQYAKPIPQLKPVGTCGELSMLVKQLQSFQPLRNSLELQDLAHQALTSLQNRQDEDIENWAAKLADDVADAID